MCDHGGQERLDGRAGLGKEKGWVLGDRQWLAGGVWADKVSGLKAGQSSIKTSDKGGVWGTRAHRWARGGQVAARWQVEAATCCCGAV